MIARILYSFVNLVSTVTVLFLTLRLIFQLLGATSITPFVAWIYNLSDGLLAPFAGLLPVAQIGELVLDWSVVIALLVYVVVGYLLSELVAQTFHFHHVHRDGTLHMG